MPNRTDDPTVLDSDLLWRRILDKPAEWYTINDDGTWRPSSAAFKDSLNEVSVNVDRLSTKKAILEGRPNDGLAGVEASVPRRFQHIVAETNEPDDPDDPSHRVITAYDISGKQRLKAAKAMAKECRRDIAPRSIRASEPESIGQTAIEQ